MSNITIQIPELFTLDDAIKWYSTCMRISEHEAREESEKLIAQIMKDENCERDFAVCTFIEDTEQMAPIDYDAIEQHAKELSATKHQAKSVDACGKKRTRERKPNVTKQDLLRVMHDAVAPNCEDVTIINSEREFIFTFCDDQYRVTLAKVRGPNKKQK